MNHAGEMLSTRKINLFEVAQKENFKYITRFLVKSLAKSQCFLKLHVSTASELEMTVTRAAFLPAYSY